jgi:hypothetical protein
MTIRQTRFAFFAYFAVKGFSGAGEKILTAEFAKVPQRARRKSQMNMTDLQIGN